MFKMDRQPKSQMAPVRLMPEWQYLRHHSFDDCADGAWEAMSAVELPIRIDRIDGKKGPTVSNLAAGVEGAKPICELYAKQMILVHQVLCEEPCPDRRHSSRAGGTAV